MGRGWDEDLEQAEHDDEVGDQLAEIDALMLAGYTYQEARVRLGYDLNRGERTV